MASDVRLAPVLSICIVNWNTKDDLRICLASIAANPPSVECEVIVVDNASSDGSAAVVCAEFPDVTLVANAENLQYARGNNQAIEASRGEFALLLNPDTEVRLRTLDRLLAFMRDHPEAGAAAPKLVNRDGSLQRSVRTFPTPAMLFFEATGLARLLPRSGLFGRYRMTFWDYDSVREVDQPMASALLLRRAALDQVGLFDEQFPMFFNDVDLCYRLQAAGWKIFFVPGAEVVHRVGASTRQVRPRMVRASHQGLLAFYRKHYRGRTSAVVYGLTIAGIWLAGQVRWLASLLSR
jgi:hypothetical protein